MHQGCFAAQLAEEEADERRRRCRRRQRARPSVAEKEGAEAEEEAAWRQTTDHTEARRCTVVRARRAKVSALTCWGSMARVKRCPQLSASRRGISHG